MSTLRKDYALAIFWVSTFFAYQSGLLLQMRDVAAVSNVPDADVWFAKKVATNAAVAAFAQFFASYWGAIIHSMRPIQWGSLQVGFQHVAALLVACVSAFYYGKVYAEPDAPEAANADNLVLGVLVFSLLTFALGVVGTCLMLAVLSQAADNIDVLAEDDERSGDADKAE